MIASLFLGCVSVVIVVALVICMALAVWTVACFVADLIDGVI